ncbi:MAG: hypothetical protein ACRBCJ_07150 [Hyphomicrobiaceae bacterium]
MGKLDSKSEFSSQVESDHEGDLDDVSLSELPYFDPSWSQSEMLAHMADVLLRLQDISTDNGHQRLTKLISAAHLEALATGFRIRQN